MGTITTAMCNSFKEELLGGTHDLDTDTLKIALIKESPTSNFGAGTTNFSDLGSDEASGTGYTSGGQNLDSATITLSGSTAFVDFADEVFSTVSLSSDGALIYNSSQSNKAVAVFFSVVLLVLQQVTLLSSFLQQMLPTAVIRIA